MKDEFAGSLWRIIAQDNCMQVLKGTGFYLSLFYLVIYLGIKGRRATNSLNSLKENSGKLLDNGFVDSHKSTIFQTAEPREAING
jgi:hypothetical protein